MTKWGEIRSTRQHNTKQATPAPQLTVLYHPPRIYCSFYRSGRLFTLTRTSPMSAPAPTPASASALPPGITDPDYSPLPGRLGNLTVPQQHALDTIRKALQDEDAFVPERMDDAALLRSVPTNISSLSFSQLAIS